MKNMITLSLILIGFLPLHGAKQDKFFQLLKAYAEEQVCAEFFGYETICISKHFINLIDTVEKNKEINQILIDRFYPTFYDYLLNKHKNHVQNYKLCESFKPIKPAENYSLQEQS